MNTAILAFLVATALRPNGDMRDVSMRPPAGVVSSSTVTIDAMPYARTVVCGEYIEVTGTASGGGAVTWSASPSGDSGSCTGTDSWACLVGVSPDDVGEGIETITVTSGTATDAVTIGFYVAGSHSCFLAQDIDGSYNATLANLDAVATWSNSGTSGLDVTQGTGTAQPTFRTGIVGGQPVVRCDGGDNLAAATATPWIFLHDGTGMTIDTVESIANTSGGGIVGTSTGAAASRGIGFWSLATAKVSTFMSDGTAIRLSVNSANSTYSINTFIGSLTTFATADTPDSTVYINNTSVATASASATSGLDPANVMRLCALGGGASNLTGDLFRVLIYQSALTATQRGINKAVDEWALGGTLPVTPPLLRADASDLDSVTTAGGLVSSWLSSGGVTASFTQPTPDKQPTQTGSGASAVVSFDGTNDVLVTTIGQSSGTSFHYFAVVDIGSITSTMRCGGGNTYDNDGIITTANSYSGLYVAESAGVVYAQAYNYDGGDDCAEVVTTSGSVIIVEGRLTGGNLSVAVNGGAYATVASGTTSSVGDTYRVGGNTAAVGRSFDGDVKEAIIYPTALSTTDRDALIVNLKAKWGIP